jgi:hypothetical protein
MIPFPREFFLYAAFSDEIKLNNRHFLSANSIKLLEQLHETIKTQDFIINTDAILFRAQIGSTEKTGTFGRAPFPPERMLPIGIIQSAGRINGASIPCLYLASDETTALSEVRPSVGDLVTLANFRPTKELRIARLYDPESTQTGEKNTSGSFIELLENEFSKPLRTSDSDLNYLPTQVISSFLKNHNYDGISFRSSLSDGINYGIFDISMAECCDRRLVEIIKIEHKFIPRHH